MEKFTYNTEELTAEQKKLIEQAQALYDSTMKGLIEDEDRRMQNYYDCIDDYSWGGLCTQANYLARDRARVALEEKIEEIVRGGFIIRTRKVNVLLDKDTGEIVAEGTHEGRYGRYFTLDDGTYVGCAKQIATFEKKGLLPYVQTITEKKLCTGIWPSGDRRYKVLEVVSLTEELSTEIQY